jgi:hypothetical protein
MSAASTTSAGLERAARRELARLARERRTLEVRTASLHAELARLTTELDEIRDREHLLGTLIVRPDPASASAPTALVLLRGRQIHEVAVRVLHDLHGTGIPVHYKQWLAELETLGYAVVGADPPATFLSSIRRSAAIVRGPTPGTYLLISGAEKPPGSGL